MQQSIEGRGQRVSINFKEALEFFKNQNIQSFHKKIKQIQENIRQTISQVENDLKLIKYVNKG